MTLLYGYMGCTLGGTGDRTPASFISVPVLSLDLIRNSWPGENLRKDPLTVTIRPSPCPQHDRSWGTAWLVSPAPGGAEQVTVHTPDAVRAPRRLAEVGAWGALQVVAWCQRVTFGQEDLGG